MYDFIEWLICYGSPIIASLKTLRFESEELQDCYDYSLFSLEKAIATRDKNIVCANIVDSLIEFTKTIDRRADDGHKRTD